MLKSIRIKNFRSCASVELRLEDQVISLVGRNGVGKTTLLNAVQLIAQVGSSSGTSRVPRSFQHSQLECEIELDFCLDSDSYTFRSSRLLRQISTRKPKPKPAEVLTKNGSVVYRRVDDVTTLPLSIIGEVRLGSSTNTIGGLLGLLPESDATYEILAKVGEYLKSIRYYSLPEGRRDPSRINNAGLSFSEGPTYIPSTAYEAWLINPDRAVGDPALMRILHLHLSADVRFGELQSLLGDDGLGIIKEIAVDVLKLPRIVVSDESTETHGEGDIPDETLYFVRFMPCAGLAGGLRWFDSSGLSAGTWRVTQLLTYLLYDASSCMLLEQPEDSIHRGLLSKLIDLLRVYSGDTQLICTTHSPRVINIVGAEGVRLVTAKDGNTVVSELTHAQLNHITSYLEDEGTLAEFLEIIEPDPLVEGDQ